MMRMMIKIFVCLTYSLLKNILKLVTVNLPLEYKDFYMNLKFKNMCVH